MLNRTIAKYLFYAVAVILFTLGLCRAAADVRDTHEDTGEYDE